MNRIKTFIKFQLRNFGQVFLTMYVCVYLIILLTVTSNYFMAMRITPVHFGKVSGFEFITLITVFVIGLNSFKESFRFFTANGVSRKTQLCGNAAALGILSAVFAFVDSINGVIFQYAVNDIPWFLQIYAPRYGYSNPIDPAGLVLSPQILVENFFWLAFTYFLAAIIGYFITVLYYRMSKGLKIAVSVAVPTVLLNGVQALDYYFFNGRISAFLKSFFSTAWGISNGYNPYIAMLSMFLFAVVFATLVYQLAKRAIVKK